MICFLNPPWKTCRTGIIEAKIKCGLFLFVIQELQNFDAISSRLKVLSCVAIKWALCALNDRRPTGRPFKTGVFVSVRCCPALDHRKQDFSGFVTMTGW
ncbi:hypothetical protein [Leisingera sp. JC1]|uniref:hypothetical protein n=1 Tax=Leisingera sp. JC1 TaxID=1855282 RepID=UPI000802FDD9|nr:hypothetical protein [Leisingera sp. JC1]OBY24709.1 hypothetical protein A9D60_08160 [Leisingera sp. JC1]